MYFKKPIQLRLLSYLFRSAPEVTDKQLWQHIGRVPMVGTYEDIGYPEMGTQACVADSQPLPLQS